MTFRRGAVVYHGLSAAVIVRQLRHDAVGFKDHSDSLYPFLLWSLANLEDQIPFRELDVSTAVDEETLALSYLCLLDRFGVGELIG